MGKISYEDKLRIQTLREQKLGAKAIVAAYPMKGWSLSTVKDICRRVDKRGSATERKAGSGRPRSVSTAENIAEVGDMICSQDGASGIHASIREIASHLNIGKSSVHRIAKKELKLNAFRRVPAQVLSDPTRLKRLERARALLRRLKVRDNKRIFFTDEKNFYLNTPISQQNNRVWATGHKAAVDCRRLIVQREKFARHVMVSAGVCFAGKSRLHFVDEKAKVNADYYLTNLIPKLIEDATALMPNGFVFQQDGAPAHTARVTQDWLHAHCAEFIAKDEWPPNSPDLNPLDYHVWGAMLEAYHKLEKKPSTIGELRTTLQKIWNDLPQKSVAMAVQKFRTRLQACVDNDGGHFEYLM